MLRTFTRVLWVCLLAGVAIASGAPDVAVGSKTADGAAPLPAAPALSAKKVSVIVIPVKDQIAEPIHFILRRGLKQQADVVVLDMNTPGGSAGTALEMMESLTKFSGKTITYVDTEAISAGAFIAAATEEIWFKPNGVIGAAAAVTSEGQDIPETMRLKINSFLRAKIRAITEGKGYRGEVVSAMIDKDYELKIGDKVLKPKGELLSLTATEASKTYGEPPQPLLAAGIAKSIDDLLIQKYGAGNYEVRTFEVTWSEKLAQFLKNIAPILMGLGMLALFIEFKTPGFGFFGIAGGILLAVVFLSNYVAGLSGHEPILVFALGALLLFVELFFFPGVVVVALTGLVLMFGSLVWSMADIWPNQPVEFSGEMFLGPLLSVFYAIVIAGVLLALIARFLPHGWIWQRLAVSGEVKGAGVAPEVESEHESLIGKEGVVATGLFPSGQVEIEGRRYEARVEVGHLDVGTPVCVVRRTDFCLMVEAKKS